MSQGLSMVAIDVRATRVLTSSGLSGTDWVERQNNNTSQARVSQRCNGLESSVCIMLCSDLICMMQSHVAAPLNLYLVVSACVRLLSCLSVLLRMRRVTGAEVGL